MSETTHQCRALNQLLGVSFLSTDSQKSLDTKDRDQNGHIGKRAFILNQEVQKPNGKCIKKKGCKK